MKSPFVSDQKSFDEKPPKEVLSKLIPAFILAATAVLFSIVLFHGIVLIKTPSHIVRTNVEGYYVEKNVVGYVYRKPFEMLTIYPVTVQKKDVFVALLTQDARPKDLNFTVFYKITPNSLTTSQEFIEAMIETGMSMSTKKAYYKGENSTNRSKFLGDLNSYISEDGMLRDIGVEIESVTLQNDPL